MGHVQVTRVSAKCQHNTRINHVPLPMSNIAQLAHIQKETSIFQSLTCIQQLCHALHTCVVLAVASRLTLLSEYRYTCSVFCGDELTQQLIPGSLSGQRAPDAVCFPFAPVDIYVECGPPIVPFSYLCTVRGTRNTQRVCTVSCLRHAQGSCKPDVRTDASMTQAHLVSRRDRQIALLAF